MDNEKQGLNERQLLRKERVENYGGSVDCDDNERGVPWRVGISGRQDCQKARGNGRHDIATRSNICFPA